VCYYKDKEGDWLGWCLVLRFGGGLDGGEGGLEAREVVARFDEFVEEVIVVG